MANTGTSKYIPPHDEGAERGLLGAIILDAGRVMDLCVVRQIKPYSFHIMNHALLYHLLAEMHDDNVPIDLFTVADRAAARKVTEKVGGKDYLEELVIESTTPAHAEYYIECVRGNELLREMIARSNATIKACYERQDDPDILLSEAEERFFALSESGGKTAGIWAPHVDDVVRQINLIADGKAQNEGMFTGFNDLDNMLAGFQPSDMIIIAARPSVGKTALALNIAERIVLGNESDPNPKAVGFFSLEMPSNALVKRMLCMRANVRSQVLRWGHFLSSNQHQQLLQAASEVRKAPLYIDDTGGLTVAELRSRARRMKRRYGIQMVMVDYLQLLKDPESARHGPQWETASISNALKAMAKELKVPVVVLSQLNRDSMKREQKRPRLSDLRDSGAIEQDADVVCLLHRPSKHVEDPEHLDDRLAIVMVAKHRNGPTGDVRLDFVEEYTRFENRAASDAENAA